ncbi:MAG: LLM class flavin-dependent oxidoreductase [Dehalococcoidia bacterium]|nr:LLM class flavin-dependent oxidoreductase [Dehalococcoidia bacterium]
MKVCFFHLMPYQGLPSDFEDNYRSAWVDAPNSLFDPERCQDHYDDYLEELQFADTVGFDGVCVNEHHNNAYGLMPSPNLIASVLSRTTSNGALIVLGNSLALYQPPVRVAEEMAMLDIMSKGRLVAGFPVGTSMDTTLSYGQTPITLREKHSEAHDLIMKAWSNREPFIFNGKYNQLRYVNIWPRPLQQPHPPVWIPGSGSLETWDWVLDRDYVYCYLSYFGYLRGLRVVNGFWDRVSERGLDDNPHRLGFLQLVCVSETDRSAEQEYSEHVKYFYRKMLRIHPPYAEAPGYRSLNSIRESIRPQIGEEAQKAAGELEWKDFIEQGHVIAGSPETVREQLVEAAKMLRVGHLMCLLHIGSMPKELTLKNTTLFANEVMPAVKNLWAEYPDPWWPQKVNTSSPAAVGD